MQACQSRAAWRTQYQSRVRWQIGSLGQEQTALLVQAIDGFGFGCKLNETRPTLCPASDFVAVLLCAEAGNRGLQAQGKVLTHQGDKQTFISQVATDSKDSVVIFGA